MSDFVFVSDNPVAGISATKQQTTGKLGGSNVPMLITDKGYVVFQAYANFRYNTFKPTDAYRVSITDSGSEKEIPADTGFTKKGFDLQKNALGLNTSDKKHIELATEEDVAVAKAAAEAEAESGEEAKKVAREIDPGRREGGTEASAPPSATSAPSAPLQTFLQRNAGLYFGELAGTEIPDDAPNAQTLGTQIKNEAESSGGPEFGKSSKAGLLGFSRLLKERLDSSGISAEKRSQIASALEGFISAAGDKAGWTGITLGGVKFGPGDDGLTAFLKFSYVATLTKDQTWDVACQTIDLPYPTSGTIATDPVIVELIREGIVQPAGLLFFAIEGEGMPEGTELSFTPGQNAADASAGSVRYKLTKDFSVGSASLLTVGRDERPGLIVATNQSRKPNITGDLAVEIIKNLGNDTTFYLQVPGERRPLKLTQTLNFGSVIFKRTRTAQLAGLSDINASLRPGVTVDVKPGQPITLAYQNLYIVDEDQIRQRDVQANLTKRSVLVPRKRDIFKLEVTSGYMLIPVRIRREMSKVEQASLNAAHWAAAILGPPPGPQPVIAHVPVTSVEFGFEGNYIDYGLSQGALPEITLVDAVPFTGKIDERDVISVTEEQANIEADPETDPAKSGIGRMGLGTPFEDQLAAYFGLPGNLVGRAAVLTPALNQAMNTPPPSSVGTFR